MSQQEFEQEIAAVTGEDRRTIRRRGFQLVSQGIVNFDPEPDQLPSQVFDWDSFDARPLLSIA